MSATHLVLGGAAIAGSAGMSYRPLLELGEGGMARIMLALATGAGGFNKLVVLKIMRMGQDNGEIRRLLMAEARLSARLNHPNVVQVHEVVHAADLPYLVMEYLDGRPLSTLRTSDVLTPTMLMTALSDALVGLHHAHELTDFDGTPLQIVHRDVSPHNIFVTYDGAVKVLDFGIAKMRHEESNTETGEVKGKLAYMPPEQLLGEAVDRRADVFAVGGILWELATGTRMWANVTQANLMHRLISGDIPRPSSVANVDPELERIIVKATAPRREDRYDTALDLRRDLDAYLESTGQRASLRDVGALLAEAFKQERQQRARAIKEALRHNSIPPAANAELDLVTGSEQQVAPRSNSRKIWIAAGVAALLVLGAGIWRHSSSGALPASPALPAPAKISLHVQASPPTAKVQIDDQQFDSASVSLTFPQDSRAHRILVFADGFVSDSRSVIFDKSLALEVALRPNASAQAEASSPTAESASASATPHASQSVHAAAARHGSNAAAPASPGAASAGQGADCNPPYYFDHGIKTYKPACL
jgi:serine/threonine-protein kinase